MRIWSRPDVLEKDFDLSFQREPDLGFAWAAYRWASGHRLESVLIEADLSAGDFVRWTKQLIDLLGRSPTRLLTNDPLRQTALRAVDALRRGVIAYSSVG